jgi:hypothetical protein
MVKKRDQQTPLVDLRKFASHLGWSELKRFEHRDPPHPPVVWYEAGEVTGDARYFALQINEFPVGQTRVFEACVYAIRYRICSGWHLFERGTGRNWPEGEADRLRLWLDRSLFATLPRRREFRQSHPECVGYSWTKISQRGAPEVDRKRMQLLKRKT